MAACHWNTELATPCTTTARTPRPALREARPAPLQPSVLHRHLMMMPLSAFCPLHPSGCPSSLSHRRLTITDSEQERKEYSAGVGGGFVCVYFFVLFFGLGFFNHFFFLGGGGGIFLYLGEEG